MTEVRRRKAPQTQRNVPLLRVERQQAPAEPSARCHAARIAAASAALLVGFAVSLLWSESQLVELNSKIQNAKAELVSEQSQYTYYNSALNNRTNITSVEGRPPRLGLMKIDQEPDHLHPPGRGQRPCPQGVRCAVTDLLHDGARMVMGRVNRATKIK